MHKDERDYFQAEIMRLHDELMTMTNNKDYWRDLARSALKERDELRVKIYKLESENEG